MQLPFLDVLLIKISDNLITAVHCKSNKADIYLNQNLFNPIGWEMSTHQFKHYTQHLTNCAHSYEHHAKHLCKGVFACTKLRTYKSLKTSLSSTPIVSKVVSYFLCLKASNIWHNKIWHSQFLSAEGLLLNIVISSVM